MADLKRPLFVDVHVPKRISEELRALGYDVLTVQQYQGTSRPEEGLTDLRIVEIASDHREATATENANHFELIHQTKKDHKGIIICKVTKEYSRMAKEIDTTIKENIPLHGKLLHVALETT